MFTDHVALPFKLGFTEVYRVFAERGVHHQTSCSSARASSASPRPALLALALGCDMINVAREAMLSIGCIQAQHCHTGHCPTGVATQNKWLMRGLDPTLKSARLANYLATLRKELVQPRARVRPRRTRRSSRSTRSTSSTAASRRGRRAPRLRLPARLGPAAGGRERATLNARRFGCVSGPTRRLM